MAQWAPDVTVRIFGTGIFRPDSLRDHGGAGMLEVRDAGRDERISPWLAFNLVYYFWAEQKARDRVVYRSKHPIYHEDTYFDPCWIHDRSVIRTSKLRPSGRCRVYRDRSGA